MSLFYLTQKIAIDLGTANTIIIVDGQIVVDKKLYLCTRVNSPQGEML